MRNIYLDGKEFHIPRNDGGEIDRWLSNEYVLDNIVIESVFKNPTASCNNSKYYYRSKNQEGLLDKMYDLNKIGE